MNPDDILTTLYGGYIVFYKLIKSIKSGKSGQCREIIEKFLAAYEKNNKKRPSPEKDRLLLAIWQAISNALASDICR